MKLTLLALTQSILNSIDSDEVNSISDTVEAGQVAQIIKDTYYTLITNVGVPEHKQLAQLEALGDPVRPNYFRIPDDCQDICDIRYNCRLISDTADKWADMTYMTPTDFLQLTQSRNSSDANNYITVNDFNGVPMYIVKNKAPVYWTSFDDLYLVFDGYDSNIDVTLQASKSSVLYSKYPSWTMDDDFIPQLDANMFPLLLSESMNMAHAVLKQSVNALINQTARQQKVHLQNDKHRIASLNKTTYPDYGRRGPGGPYSRPRLH